ncbi:hypothetical protein PCC6912_40000 [Chlorogloeopsis fritschii PCC 6912]|uniref:Uncharacterized protein n=1 Tax=Chlorogloeopsis fritschii PCC 6912 TaxID=211165 RepID=A0A3S0ZTF6_CHLFR|nr:hypothetical protein [Chlorogloeopsis fritschii]RUR77041.1 hypothetical protein PCC6912_40000 [Chlorogloeopsis fritschii PCC 6912]
MSKFDFLLREIQADLDIEQLRENRIRSFYARQRAMLARENLLHQELQLEQELLDEYPEMAEFIHQINTVEMEMKSKGFRKILDKM